MLKHLPRCPEKTRDAASLASVHRSTSHQSAKKLNYVHGCHKNTVREFSRQDHYEATDEIEKKECVGVMSVAINQSIMLGWVEWQAGRQLSSLSLWRREKEAEKRKEIRGAAWNSGESRRGNGSGGITGKRV
ncbi:unnamed protein product [Onchocerca flexuosa]|uniref:Uncharacterized protein n=1 Tax=Onchocerca flexuosa TaxID=387005 RepID=A0A183I5J8_9BILA|nr:unnamed protein product [Onchocerca flexuosa]